MRMQNPPVNIVIVNFNGKKHLKVLLESLSSLNYEKTKLEIIFVDNCSSDGSVQLVSSGYPAVKIIENSENHYCKAVNLGIKASKAKYVALLNTDTKVDKNWLIELVVAIGADKKIAATGSKILTFDGKIQNAGHYELPNFYWGERGAGREVINFNNTEEIVSLCGAAVLYDRAVIVRLGLFDQDFIMYGEDVDMAFRIRKSGYKLVFAPKSIVYHRFHGSGNEEMARYYIERNRLLYIAKHFPTKLSNALVGSGHFTASRSPEACGSLKAILPEVFRKLFKEHGSESAKIIIEEALDELNRINNGESDVLIQKAEEEEEKRDKLIGFIASQEKELQRHRHLADQAYKYKSLIEQAKIKRLRQNEHTATMQQRLEEHKKLLEDQQKESARAAQQRAKVLEEHKKVIEEYAQKTEELIEKLHLSVEKGLILQGQLIEQQLNHEQVVREIRSQAQDTIAKKESESEELRQELNSIKYSTGYKFVLWPLWQATVVVRKLLRATKRLIRNIFYILPCAVLIVLLCLAFCVEALIWKLLGRLLSKTRKRRPSSSGASSKISLVMPNYNGVEILKQSLPTIFATPEFADGSNEVLIVDDGSTDDSVQFIKKHYPQIRILENEKNMQFGHTCNKAVANASNEIVILINNDIMLKEGFLKPLLQELKDDVFAVTPKMYGWDKQSFVWGMHMGHFKDGYIRLWNECETKNGDRLSQAAPSIFAIGGAMVFRKEDFLWLKGFDDIYKPNCWEDIDISYRAWKRGLRVSYIPESLLYHKDKATLTYERPKEIKNELLFMWKNITDTNMVTEHLLLLPRNIAEGGISFIHGLFWAITYLPVAMVHRLLERRYAKRSDRSIFNQCMNFYRNAERRNFKQVGSDEKRNILLVTSFLPYPLNKGGSIRIDNLVTRLKKDYNIYLLSLINHEDEKRHIEVLKTQYAGVYVAQASPEEASRLFPMCYRYSYSSEMIAILQSIQEEIPLDIVQIESNELLYLLDYIKHVPVAYTEHDSSALFMRDTYYKRHVDESVGLGVFDYLKRLYCHRKGYKKIDKSIVLSERDRQIMRTFFPKTRFALVPTGVDLVKFNSSISHKKPKRLMFVGHYLHYPNEEAAIYFAEKILPLIKRQIPDVEFCIVGSAPTERVINLQKKDSSVKVIGEVDDISDYLKKAAVFVNPIRSSWGIKGKVLEAMASGAPVVSTSKGAAGIHTINKRGLVIADSPQRFANKVVELLENNELYTNVARTARNIVERWYNWDCITEELKCTYDSLLKNIVATQENHYFKPLTVFDVVATANKTVQKVLDSTDIYANHKTGPKELHIELDYKCNSRCIMCDLWDTHKRTPLKKPLSLDEIKSVIDNSQRLQDIRVVVLSGGEPFLRNDIGEIAEYILKRYPGVSLGILTNGIDTEHIIEVSRQIIREYKPNNFWLGSSLDGVGDQHDVVRGIKGAYANLEKTAAACKYNNIPFTLTFTLTSRNYDQILLASKAAKGMGTELYVQFAVVKEAREKQVFDLSPEQLKKAEKDIEQLIKEKVQNIDISEYIADPLQEKFRMINAQLYYLSNITRYYKHPARYFNQCVAGKRFAMLSPYGDLYFCSKLKKGAVGNIRKTSFDSIWQGEEAEMTRQYIRDSLCHCWLVCTIFPTIDEAWNVYMDDKEQDIKHLIPASKGKPPANKQECIELAPGQDPVCIDRLSGIQQANNTLNTKEQATKSTELISLPKIIGVGLHWKCNASCLFCNASQHPDLFNFNTYKRFFEKRLTNILASAEAVNLCGAGELLLMPEIEKFLSYLRITQPHLLKIITTNGSPLIKANKGALTADRISLIVFLHASNEDLHKSITGLTDFKPILKAIEELLQLRTDGARPSIDLKFVANTFNIEDLPSFVELAHSIGVDQVGCDYMQIPSIAHAKLSCFFKQEITNRMLALAEEKAAKLNMRIQLPPRFNSTGIKENEGQAGIRCSDPWEYAYVESEGSVLPCCFNPQHIGYLYKESFKTIWNGVYYKNLRQSLIDGKPVKTCTFCYRGDPANVNKLESHISPSSQYLRSQLLQESS